MRPVQPGFGGKHVLRLAVLLPQFPFLAKHGFLIGSVVLGFVIFHIGTTIAGQVAALACAVQQLTERIPEAEESAQEPLRELAETVDSLHTLFGGRIWRRDELHKDTYGPTVQELLKSIDRSLKAIAPQRQEPSKILECGFR